MRDTTRRVTLIAIAFLGVGFVFPRGGEAQDAKLRTREPATGKMAAVPDGPSMQETVDWLATHVPQFPAANWKYQILENFDKVSNRRESVSDVTLNKCSLHYSIQSTWNDSTSIYASEVQLSDVDVTGVAVKEIASQRADFEDARRLIESIIGPESSEYNPVYTPSWWRVQIPIRSGSPTAVAMAALTKGPLVSSTMAFAEREDARRVAKAIQRAAVLCGAKSDVF